MSIRIAVASRDGKFVNEHFGRAERFLIFDLKGKFLEERVSERVCQNGEHDESSFEKTAKLLSDCKAIVVSKIGYGASSYMESRGFELFEAGMPIDDALFKLRKYYERGEQNVSDL